MRAREKGLRAETQRITVLHWIPAPCLIVTTPKTLFQARLAGQVALSTVLIDETRLFKVLKVGIFRTQYELQIDVVVKLSVHRAFQTSSVVHVVFDSWAACVPSYVAQALVAPDFNPIFSLSKCSSHSWVSDYDAKVFLALLRHKCLVQWL